MSDQPGLEAGMERQQAPSAEQLRRQQALAQVEYRLSDLERQWAALQGQMAAYAWQAQLARQGDQEHLARQALEQRQRLSPYLLGLQQQIEQLRQQRARLVGPDASLLAEGGAAPGDWASKQQRSPKRRRRVLALGLVGMIVVVVLAPLTLLLLTRHAGPSAGPTTAAASTRTPAPTSTPTLAPQQPFYTPAGTAPTSQDCQAAVAVACYSPEQIQQAFRLNPLYRQGYDGSGQTIVILGAGNTATLQSDLHMFDTAWGLPDPRLTILHPFGAPAPYTCSGGVDDLQGENTLDIEWSHAIAPGANITLVIGSNDSGGPPEYNCGFANIQETFAYALNQHLGSIISISYGGSELGGLGETAGQQEQDKAYYSSAHQLFQQAAAEGVTVLASAGDDGATNPNAGPGSTSVWNQANVAWPSSDPYVLAVGGTTLTLQDMTGDYGSEVVWNDSKGATGGGLSVVFSEPAYQQTLRNQKPFKGMRGVPDVAFPAAVNYVLYGSFAQGKLAQARPQWNGWHIIGGTSAAAPSWAGLIAIANQMRGGPVGFIQPALYNLGGQGMHDIISGNNTYSGVQGYQAQPGYDLATGWGTPLADQFIPALVQEVNRLETGCGTSQHQCN